MVAMKSEDTVATIAALELLENKKPSHIVLVFVWSECWFDMEGNVLIFVEFALCGIF